ncbi:MAG: hypothetical protein HC927_08840, partial [Deltaproteobacteria bacterium]|nr:hypothetical protein [Deltaproteobacteria bacterium]
MVARFEEDRVRGKDGSIHIADVETGQTTLVATDPWANISSASWSHDSAWLAIALAHPDNVNLQIHLYEVATGTLTPVTSPMFSSESPAFDRKGEYLYFATGRNFSPRYGSIERTWIYTDADVIMAVPLREDVANPLLPKSDEVSWKKDDEDKDKEQSSGEEGEEDAAADLGAVATLAGSWSGEAWSEGGENRLPVTLVLTVENDTVSGTVEAMGESGAISDVEWNADPARLTFIATIIGQRHRVVLLREESDEFEGTWSNLDTGASGLIELEKEEAASEEDGEEAEKKDDEKEPIKIDLEGFEGRAFALPIDPGSLGNLRVNDKNQLLYLRGSTIEIFDLHEKKEEDRKPKTVVSNAAAVFELSPDGSKILTITNPGSDTSPIGMGIADAKASSKVERFDTAGLAGAINPREEWRQIFTDSWRHFRDWFYDANMHGVDWRGVYDHYAAMLPDAVNREDVGFLIAEMISELNVGHAYYRG